MCNKVYNQDSNSILAIQNIIKFCMAFLFLNVHAMVCQLQHKRFSQPPAAASEQPSKKKLRAASGKAVPADLYELNNVVPQIKIFSDDVWRIITSYATITGLINHPVMLRSPLRRVRVEKERGKIVQTALGNSGTIALRTTRGFVQVHSNTGDMVLDTRVPYVPNGSLELSDNEEMLRISDPNQVWNLKTGKQMQGVNFDAHKAASEVLFITSSRTEMVMLDKELITITGLPAGHKASLESGEGKNRMIVIPYNPGTGTQRRGVQVFDQTTGNKVLDLPGQRVRQDCFDHGGPLITSSNNQDLVWEGERAIYRVDKKLMDTKISPSGNVLIGTNGLGSAVQVWDLAFLKTTQLTVDQTIFLWAIDAYKTRHNGAPMRLSDLVTFCDHESVTIEEVQRVYASIAPILKAALIETYRIIED